MVFAVDSKRRRLYTAQQLKERRMAIAYFYNQVYLCCDGKMDGRDGIVARIRKKMCLPSSRGVRRSIRNTIRVINVFKAKNVPYCGEPEPRKDWEDYYIKKDSFEATLIAKLLMGGFGFRYCTQIVNKWRTGSGETFVVGRLCVYDTHKQ